MATVSMPLGLTRNDTHRLKANKNLKTKFKISFLLTKASEDAFTGDIVARCLFSTFLCKHFWVDPFVLFFLMNFLYMCDFAFKRSQ